MRYIKFFILCLLLFACKKKKDQPIPITSSLSNGILVLNEGLFQYNNASLSWIDLQSYSVNNQFFEQKADRYLGDTGNDLKRYGNKIYIVVNVSGTIEVLNASTGSPVKQISLVDGNQNKQPRSIAFFGSKAFVSCFDGYVDVIDTTTLQIEKRIKVGLNPDQIIASSSRIFVSNSGGLNFPELDSTLSIINPQTLEEEGKLIVGKNPGDLEIINNELFVITRGDYGTHPASLLKINLDNFQIEDLGISEPLLIEAFSGTLLIAYQEGNTTKIGNFNVETKSWIQNSFIPTDGISTLYQIQFETLNNHIYLFDAQEYTNSGKITEWDQNGSNIRSYTVGLIPSSLLLF